MEIVFDFKNIFYIFSQFIGYLVALVLIITGLKGKKNNIFLGFNFLFLTYSSFIIWLITTGYFVHFPQLYRTGNLSGLFFIPMMFLYVRSEIKKQPISAWDLLHLLPAFVFLVDFWPVFALSSDEKLQLIKSEISDPSLFTQFRQSRFFGPDFYTPFRSVLIAVYWSLSVYWVFTGTKSQMKKGFAKEWFIWIKIFLVLESMVFLPALFLYGAIAPITAYHLAHLSIVVLNLGTGISLLAFPKILYGLDQKAFESPKAARKSKNEILSHLPDHKIAEIKTRLQAVLNVDKKFLIQGYTLNELSKDTGIPGYLLTLYINNTLSTSFPDLINKERIEECCKMMASGKYSHYATEGFSQLCGFSNRNTFSLAFKKYKGTTPSAYYKRLKNESGRESSAVI